VERKGTVQNGFLMDSVLVPGAGVLRESELLQLRLDSDSTWWARKQANNPVRLGTGQRGCQRQAHKSRHRGHGNRVTDQQTRLEAKVFSLRDRAR
jgi:hypothetical protein